MIIGIDNGLTGAIAVLSDVPGLPPAALIPMPTLAVVRDSRMMGRDKVKSRAKAAKEKSITNEVDTVALRAIIRNLGPTDQMTVFFEECPDHAPSAAALRSMAINAGKVLAVLELCGLSGSTIRIQSHTWQPAMLGSTKRGDTKAASLAVARQFWPSQDWRKSKRATTPDTGFVDAALIALWGQWQMQGQNFAASKLAARKPQLADA